MFTKIGYIFTLKTDNKLLSSFGNNRLVQLTTHFIANALIALITCHITASFIICPDQVLLRRQNEGRGGRLSMQMIKILTPANNVFYLFASHGLNMFHK